MGRQAAELVQLCIHAGADDGALAQLDGGFRVHDALQLGQEFSLATFETRYKFSLKDTESRSLTTEVKVSDTASENMNFAAGVAAYAMVLHNSMYKGKATLSLAKELVSGASTYDPDGFRAELLGLMEIVRP